MLELDDIQHILLTRARAQRAVRISVVSSRPAGELAFRDPGNASSRPPKCGRRSNERSDG